MTSPDHAELRREAESCDALLLNTKAILALLDENERLKAEATKDSAKIVDLCLDKTALRSRVSELEERIKSALLFLDNSEHRKASDLLSLALSHAGEAADRGGEDG